MPSKSPAQARMMAAAAHSPKFAERVGVPQGVAKEFNQADAKTGILKSAHSNHMSDKHDRHMCGDNMKDCGGK